MIFDVASMVHYVRQCMVLQPGDVLTPGSPAGMALGRPEQPYLRDGDIVEAEVSGGAHSASHAGATGPPDGDRRP
jgi:2-keto-4-pentenoate hydratase/2-oxohepta-3-ene-1,7-dioic acid hydratase in catechol pathway